MLSKLSEINTPDKIKVSKDFQHLRIVKKWFGLKFIFLTLFVIIWDAFLINWYSIQFSRSLESIFDLLFILFPLFHLLVGVILTYYVLAGYLNKTFIDVDFNSITVRHEPLPFWGNKKVSTKTIKRLYYEWDDFFGIPDNRRSGYHFFAVYAITNEKRIIKLVRGLDNNEQALFVKQEIGKFLNIDEFTSII